MFQFFVPTTKVQKDRLVMRETDSRMAKYSRRGIIFNFIAYLVCLLGGRFVDENGTLTVVLTSGLLLITILRGYFLFRFDYLYPGAPARWRNMYFVATLLGALWWGLIMVAVTLRLEMQDEAPLFWLYTVVFFSTTAHAFAPYERFLTYYQFIGQVPGAIAAFFIGDITGYIYGTLLLVFYIVLNHQCRIISENYWERLEATYALARKTRSIEEEKRDTRASVKLSNEFLRFLREDLKFVVDEDKKAISEAARAGDITLNKERRDITRSLEQLYKNIDNFTSALTKEIKLETRVFNIRHELQHIIAEYVDICDEQDVQIESSLSPNLPMRLKGDSSRLSQILNSLLSLCTKEMNGGLILVEVEFLREYETAGELYITITRLPKAQKRRFFVEESVVTVKTDLNYVVASALAEYMDGEIESSDIPGEGQRFRISAKLQIAEVVGQLDFHKNYFSGHNVLLVHNNARIVDIKRQELDALGFNVITETQYKRAYQLLENSYKTGKPIESVLYYVEAGLEDALMFNKKISEHPELHNTHQLVASTRAQHIKLQANDFKDMDHVCYVNRPTGLFELESSFQTAYQNGEDLNEELNKDKNSKRKLVIYSYSKNPDTEHRLHERLNGLEYKLIVVTDNKEMSSFYKEYKPEVVLVDCDELIDAANLVTEIRELEEEIKVEMLVPILGVSTEKTGFESSVYEIGFDDYIDLSDRRRSLRAMVTYWKTLKLTE